MLPSVPNFSFRPSLEKIEVKPEIKPTETEQTIPTEIVDTPPTEEEK